MIVTGTVFFDDVEYNVEDISEELKARIIAECPSMANAIWDTPLPSMTGEIVPQV